MDEHKSIMTRDTAIQLAEQLLADKPLPKPYDNFELFKVIRKKRDDRNVWLVIFYINEEPDVVTSPGEIYVEVDEETETAIVLSHM